MEFSSIKQEMKFLIDLNIGIYIKPLSIKKILCGIIILMHKAME